MVDHHVKYHTDMIFQNYIFSMQN